MDPLPRHQCLIYEGSPSKHLAALAAVIRDKLEQNYRCLYLNSHPMVAGMRSYLAAQGVDVLEKTADGNLVLSSEHTHLVEGRFDVARMMQTLRESVAEARKDGYAGLWATGDMTWEFGPEKDLSKLLDYEWQLEAFMQENPDFGGVCQYHAGTLPRTAMRQALVVHPAIFVNETLAYLNPHSVPRELMADRAANDPAIEAALSRLLQGNCQA